MIVNDLVNALERIAPRDYAAEWDNVGLLAGSSQWNVHSVLLTIDLTDEVLSEAIDAKAGLIVSYHPPIFSAIKSLTDRSPHERIVMEALAARIAMYSPHTALDAAPGGLNDWLASCIGSGDVRALEPHQSLPETEQCKIVTFCPTEAVERLRNGLASIGAGRIGRYQLCSFELKGRGTFFAGEGASPRVGMRGSLQHVDETRLEMVCPRAALGLAVATLRELHPYEEPPVEIHPLMARPQRHIGHGRRVTLDQAVGFEEIVDRLKRQLDLRHVQVAIGRDAPPQYSRVGLCAGAGGSLMESALDQECQMYFTGEMRHHDVIAAQARGCTVVLTGHTNTERGYLKILRQRMLEHLPDANIVVSKRDRDPLRVM